MGESEQFEVVIIGAGQAGLALGYYLRQQGLRFLMLDGAMEIGASWRNRWDSLRLFTPAQYDALSGLPFSQPKGSYPGKDGVADYLKRYADTFNLPVRLGSRVVSLKREGEGYLVRTEAECFEAEQVVVATGPFQQPFVPEFGRNLSAEVVQLHSSDYKNPDAFPPGEVLVVGAGNSGMQIAEELAASRGVTLSRGRPLPTVPRRILGRSLFWWLETFGLTKVTAHSAFGRFMKRHDEIVIGARPDKLIRSGRLAFVPRAVQAEGDTVGFSDGTVLKVRTVIWATGYKTNYGWVDVPVFDDRGHPIHRRGVTAASGLYFLGLRWQHTTGSALLGWVKRDAAFVAERIRQKRQRG
jgi:putative flavoprotein involved in K+ transport